MAAKTVLITGSSAGIGKATAELFHHNGWNVVATMRSPQAGSDLAALKNVLVVPLDVTDEASIAAALKAAETRFGGIDVLVNNAGYGAYGVLEATPVDSIRKQYETNVIGLLATTLAVLPGMRQRRSGVVVNVSSVISRIAFPFASLYASSKFAVEGLSEALSFELREIGVRVKIIEPGIIHTNFANAMEFRNDESLVQYQPLMARFLEFVTVLRSKGSTSEVAAQAIYGAATDGTDQLRYLVGDDANEMVAERSSMSDDEYFSAMRKRYGQ